MRTIRNNGDDFMSGDDLSMTMFYNDIVGKNIHGADYKKYLKMAVSKGLQYGVVELYEGDTLLDSQTISEPKH